MFLEKRQCVCVSDNLSGWYSDPECRDPVGVVLSTRGCVLFACDHRTSERWVNFGMNADRLMVSIPAGIRSNT